jgi:hypothetical protein
MRIPMLKLAFEQSRIEIKARGAGVSWTEGNPTFWTTFPQFVGPHLKPNGGSIRPEALHERGLLQGGVYPGAS